MAPLRTAFSVTVTGEPVSPGAEPRECAKRLVAPRTPRGLFWRNERDVFVSRDGACVQEASLIRDDRKCVDEKFRKRREKRKQPRFYPAG